jgi:hypothetical protein
MTDRSNRAPFALLLGFALFVAALGYIVASSVARREAPTFEPSPVVTMPQASDTVVVDTVTIDARDANAWRYFDFATGSVIVPPDTAGWDIAFRRFHVMVAGAAADLGAVAFDLVTTVPSAGFVVNSSGSNTANPSFDNWYRYNVFSHLLEPDDHVYVVRTADERYAKIEFLGYYCPGVTAGCPTIRYAYQPSGSTTLP